MKKKFILLSFIIAVFSSMNIYSRDIKEFSFFRIMGETDLRLKSDFSAPVIYRTLNHEGGMKLRVIEKGKSDQIDSKKGIWLYVKLTAPMWVDSGDWIKKDTTFWIFLDDETEIFDYEE